MEGKWPRESMTGRTPARRGLHAEFSHHLHGAESEGQAGSRVSVEAACPAPMSKRPTNATEQKLLKKKKKVPSPSYPIGGLGLDTHGAWC